MSTQAPTTLWPADLPRARKTMLVHWLTRRRIAISLTGFASLVCINILVVRAVPYNPLAVATPEVAVALAAILLGLLIRTWSAGTLNKSREITSVGPYAIVRNPLYIGSFLMMFGFCLLCRDWPTLLFVAGPVSWLYWIQVRFEEERLSAMFPAHWPDYAASVPRCFPRRLNRRALRGWSAEMWLMNREYQALAASGFGLLAVYVWYRISHA